ncbi:MAG: DNA polymerase III subunit beta [Patescibacteria group bacterium]|nr:DNA polymerase III subunit beta [Patescibacteria group bacterium]
MKIEVLRENLERAVSVAAKVSNKNLSLPVLGCILLSGEGGQVKLQATNLDLSILVNLKAKLIEDGVVAVPSQIFYQTMSALTDQKLTLTTTGNTLTIEGERGTTSLSLIDPSEFPKLPQVKKGEGSEIMIPAHTLGATLRSVAFSASTSSVKPELSSVCLSLEKGELVAAATDSFRLAEVRVPLKTKNSFGPTLLPARNINDILRTLEAEDEVEIRIGENQISLVSDFATLTSRTIDGSFPDYQSIIPREFVVSATCLKEDAVQAFRKISIFTDSFNQVHIAMKPSEKTFTVRAVNASVGETTDHVPAALEGEDLDINFNAKYVTDALSSISGDSIAFSVAGAGRPMVIRDVPNKGFTYLVMPMNR